MKKAAGIFILLCQLALVGIFVRYNFGRGPSPFDESMKADAFVLRMALDNSLDFPKEKLRQNDIAFGRALYRRFRDIPAAEEVCGNRELRDCNAGVLIEFVNGGKTDKLSDLDFIDKIERSFCRGSDPEKCYSNLGQGLIDLAGGEIKTATAYCGKLRAQAPAVQFSCITGAYRRWIKTGGQRVMKFPDSYDEDCAKLPEHRLACHRAVGGAGFFPQWSLGRINADDICRKGAETEQNQCLEGAFAELLLRAYYSEKRKRELCASFTDGPRKLKCLEFLRL